MLLVLLIVAFVASVAVAQSGCAAGSLPANQTVQWVPCPVDEEPTLECGTIDVPLDYTSGSSSLLTLGLVRVPASDTSAKSIVYNPGGPGSSGIQSLIGSGADMQT